MLRHYSEKNINKEILRLLLFLFCFSTICSQGWQNKIFCSVTKKENRPYFIVSTSCFVLIACFIVWRTFYRNLPEQEIMDRLKALVDINFNEEKMTWNDLKYKQRSSRGDLKNGEKLLIKWENDEKKLLLKLPEELAIKRSEFLSKSIVKLKFLIRSAYIEPILVFKTRKPKIAVYHIYHPKQLDESKNDAVACAPYTIAFAKAIDKLVEDKILIWRGSIEGLTKNYFKSTEESIDIGIMLNQIYLFDEIDNNDTVKRCVGLYNNQSYSKSDFVIPDQDELQKEVKNVMKNNKNKAFHFLTRTGGLNQGHWCLFSFVPEYGQNNTPVLLYLNNSNRVLDETKQIAEKIISDFIN